MEYAYVENENTVKAKSIISAIYDWFIATSIMGYCFLSHYKFLKVMRDVENSSAVNERHSL
jgi:hypothetical protein